MAESADDGNAISLLLNLTKEVSGVLRCVAAHCPHARSALFAHIYIYISGPSCPLLLLGPYSPLLCSFLSLSVSSLFSFIRILFWSRLFCHLLL